VQPQRDFIVSSTTLLSIIRLSSTHCNWRAPM